MVEQPNPPEKTGKRATIFAVTSGKGGVGKTSLSVNLACEFSRRGFRTIIVDTDLGLANAHILAGIKPAKTLSDYIEGKAELSEIIEPGPCKVKFISGGNGVKETTTVERASASRSRSWRRSATSSSSTPEPVFRRVSPTSSAWPTTRSW
jgi:flagellar biosynthesis protein FlhG